METNIALSFVLDGRGKGEADTGIGFLDHMLCAFARHGGFDLKLHARGDLEVDQHHTVEDCGIVLGQAIERSLGRKIGIQRAGYHLFPMDESLAFAAVDLGGRPYLKWRVRFRRRSVGGLETDLIPEFFRALAVHSRANWHLSVPYGWNDHHKAEALFKAAAKALGMAAARGRVKKLPSTKGLI
jgi:imidazoleglycerol-phosphate dehydratase